MEHYYARATVFAAYTENYKESQIIWYRVYFLDFVANYFAISLSLYGSAAVVIIGFNRHAQRN